MEIRLCPTYQKQKSGDDGLGTDFGLVVLEDVIHTSILHT